MKLFKVPVKQTNAGFPTPANPASSYRVGTSSTYRVGNGGGSSTRRQTRRRYKRK
jgi:hypothetical protein